MAPAGYWIEPFETHMTHVVRLLRCFIAAWAGHPWGTAVHCAGRLSTPRSALRWAVVYAPLCMPGSRAIWLVRFGGTRPGFAGAAPLAVSVADVASVAERMRRAPS